jgi:hypothetical protein
MPAQFRCKCSRQQVWSANIGLHDAVQNFSCQRVQVPKRKANVPTGVVDKDVEPAELSHNLLDAAIDRVRIALIQLYTNASPADLLHGLDSRTCALRITHVRNRNVHPRFSLASRYGAANIVGTSRDESGLSSRGWCTETVPKT